MTGKCIYKNITKPEINFVLISLCTCKRPKMLKNALKSIENIICPENIKIEVLVVDNDINKIFYFFKNSLVLLGNLLLIIPVFFMGLTFLFNILCICSRTFGKLEATRKNVPYNFFKNIYGE